MLKVFVCDGDSKAALAITRSLGQKGVHVIVGTHMITGRALFSKYCNEIVHYPDPHDEFKLINFMLDYLSKNKIDVLIPVSYMTCRFFSKYKHIFKNTEIPVADWDSMKLASDKRSTMEIADMCEVPRPETGDYLNFPLVVKSNTESKFLKYVNTKEEYDKIDMSGNTAYEYIPGFGYGYVALYDHGKLVVDFMHVRLREYPITGGPSTFAKSVYYPELKQYGEKIFSSLNWHGVGMCEFKLDSRDQTFKLIEINPKFWGSIDLPMVCGVDFPYQLLKLTHPEIPNTPLKYQAHSKMFRWIFPSDILCLLANPSIFMVWLDDLFVYKICRFSLDRSDWKPELFNVLMTPYAIIQAIKNGLKYPHGVTQKSPQPLSSENA